MIRVSELMICFLSLSRASRSCAVPLHAPDVVREASPGPLQHPRHQMGGGLLQAVLQVGHQGGLPHPEGRLHQRTYQNKSSPSSSAIAATLLKYVPFRHQRSHVFSFHDSVQAHLSHNSKFDFHKYIKRSMEDDFKVVVGIR
uniref:Uncharacterized protein n=1 Tax=Aegilops tauschii subsp. strangulata TaxID=200361 RepID=A0A453J2G0_AEGTS